MRGGECGAKRGSLPSPSRDRVTKNHLCHSTAVSTVDSTDEVRGGGASWGRHYSTRHIASLSVQTRWLLFCSNHHMIFSRISLQCEH